MAPPMSVSRGEAAVTAIGNQLLICGGGAERDRVLDTCEAFDPRGLDPQGWGGVGRWTPLPAMPEARCKHASAVLGGRFVVCGGSSQQFCEWLDPSPVEPVERWPDSISASAAIYCGEAGAWQVLPSMLSPRAGHTASAVSGTILVCGGAGLNSVEALSLEAGAWSALQPMQVPRSRHAAAFSGRYLIVSGGFNETDFQVNSSVERYDPLTGTWVLMDGMQLDLPRCNHCMVSIATTLIATPQQAVQTDHMTWKPKPLPDPVTDVEPDEKEMDLAGEDWP